MTTPRRILQQYGLRPRKRLGQCFLQDGNIVHKIIDAAHIRDHETVIEIGAGLGVMTEMMAKKARRVIALEVDPFMIRILRERLGGIDHVEVVETDVLRYDFSAACPHDPAEKLKVVGNVPYHISSPLLFHLISFRRAISTAVLMLQQEVVDRLLASPGTKDYGIPTVILSMYAELSRIMDVPGSCFFPEPAVTSSVLKMTPREEPLIELKSEKMFGEVVRAAFAQRRKTLLNNLRHAYGEDTAAEDPERWLQAAGIDGRRRAETLSLSEFALLANRYLFEKN